MRQRIDAVTKLAVPLRRTFQGDATQHGLSSVRNTFEWRFRCQPSASPYKAFRPEQSRSNWHLTQSTNHCRAGASAFPPARSHRYYSAKSNTSSSNGNEDLPSKTEGRRSHLSKRFSNLMDHAQANIFIAGQRLNDLTGYSGIEVLKQEIESQEKIVQSTRTALRDARDAYSAAITTRASSQREVNQLLQRKHAWSPEDLERFTSLYRSDHANEQGETTAREDLSRAENESEEAAAKLNASILARYHEEQIWSDKIRRMSTWGTWGLMGVNVLLFFIFQVGVEPWRRNRLVKGFEEKVKEALEGDAAVGATDSDIGRSSSVADGRGEVDAPVDGSIVAASDVELNEGADRLLGSPPLPATSSIVPVETGPRAWLGQMSATLQNMFSEQPVTIRRVDITTAMFEGAAAGVVLVGTFVLLLRPR